LDPIVRSIHPSVQNLTTELQLSGSFWDDENNSSLFYTMPSWIVDGDESNGTNGDLRKLTQIMSTYLDNLDLLIGELPKLNMASYPSSSVSPGGEPDKLFEIYPHIQTAVRSFGLDAPELFSNGNILEYYRNRDETREFEEDLNTVKKIIYNNIYNNLADIYKAKGTEKSFRNLIRCFGVGDDLIRINAYADNDTYKFETKRRAGSVKSKAVNFSIADNFAGTVYQYADTSNPNSVSFISGSSAQSLTLEDGFPITVEAEVVFPKKISTLHESGYTQEFPFTTASLFGMHTARASQATSPTVTDITWAASDVANFQVFAIRDQIGSKDVKFMLTSSNPFPVPELTSSFYQNAYENQKWNFAVRIKPKGYPQSFSSGTVENSYIVEFYGVNYIADRQIHEFNVTGTISKQTAENLLISPKRLFVGSHKTNFTGSTLQFTDTKITSCRYWFNYLDNSAIQNHALDPTNFGHPRPNRNTYLLQSDLADVEVPEIESLALYWDFQTVTGSDDGSGSPTTFDGKFVVEDVSSGSLALISRYDWLGKILKYQHTGRGDAFPINSTSSVETQFLYAGKQQLPEIVFGDDNIRVLNQEETEIFTKETRPTKTYYAFEKSMYQIVSDEIINYFGSIADFNNLIGDPVNRYRHEYKSLNYLRQFFFERVSNTPDLDKFVEYYKWIDSTLEVMLMQLTPASAQFSDGIDNVVESHVLERNKYWTKFPTLEFVAPDIEGGTISVNKRLYDWKRGHRPLNSEENNCLYWKQRAERDDLPLSSSVEGVNASKNSILSASLQMFQRRWTTAYRTTVEKDQTLRGGINYSENKKTNFYRGINFPHGPVTSIGLPMNVLNAYNIDVVTLKDCDDEIIPNQKIKYSFGTNNGRTNDSGSFDGIKGEIAMPFNILSASQGLGGYNSKVQDRFLSGSQLVNLHSDGYGDRNEVPMQGPFTEKYVGGKQSRHVRLNSFDADRIGGDGEPGAPDHAGIRGLDAMYTRPEGYRLLLGGGPHSSGAIGLTGPDYGGPYPDPTRFRAWFFREETAKRPVNIRNILQTTASLDRHLSGTLQFGAIGNYEKTYQVVQTSGRSTNNFFFNDDGVTLPRRYRTSLPATTNVHTLVGVRPYTSIANRRRGNTFLPGPNVGGAPNVASLRRLSNRYFPFKVASAQEARTTVFRLPDRTKQDAVIVERFSAPGGPEINSLGFLDIMAAEKSVYNVLPFRNLSVRGSGSGEEIRHIPAGGTIKVQDHLGHRRGLRTLAALHAGPFGSDGTYGTIVEGTYVTSPSFYKINRNARFVVKADVDATHDSLFQYGSGTVFDNWHIQHPIPQNDFQYSWISGSILSGTAGNGFGHSPKSGQVSGSNGFKSAITFLSSSMPDYSASFTVIGFPSTFHPYGVVDFVGLNNLIYDPTGSAFNIISSSGDLISYRNDALVNNAVGVVSWGQPGAASATGRSKSMVFNALMLHRNGPYGYSSWRQINNRYHSLVRQMRDSNTISTIDPSTERPNTRLPIKYPGYKWSSTKTTQGIFGGQTDGSGLIVTQDRSVLTYHEPVVEKKFKPLEFVGNISGVRASVKSSYANNKVYFTNSKLNENLKLDEKAKTVSDDVFAAFNTPGNLLINVTYSEDVYPAAINLYRPFVRQRPSYASLFWKDEREDRNVTRDTAEQIEPNVIFGSKLHTLSQSIWPLDARTDFDSTPEPVITTGRANSLNKGASMGVLMDEYNTVHNGFPDSEFSGTLFSTGNERGLPFITASAVYARRHTLLTGSSARAYSTAFSYRLTDNLVPFSGDAPWDAPRQSGKNPFYNSYEDYIQEMRTIGKDYSILPEYRISDRMDDYIVNGVDPFNDTDMLSLTGSLDDADDSGDEDFYKTYSHSDFMKYFGVVENDVENNLNIDSSDRRVTIRCKALLKLLPYNGFYPANRTAQLANLFSQSYGNNIISFPSASGAPKFPNASVRPLYAPMFAPGVLFNTIKSGIACDYPVITGTLRHNDNTAGGPQTLIISASELMDAGTGQIGNFYIGNPQFDYRVPFESLVEPQNFIKDVAFIDNEPHPSASINATASWNGDGDERYRLAMHNFLAETPDFFLENGTFTSFVSKPESDIEPFDKEFVYSMRVRIKKSFNDNSNVGSSQLSLEIPWIANGKETICMYSRPSAFGPPVAGAQQTASATNGIEFDIDGAGYGGSEFGHNGPFTPPYYDGGAFATITFEPEESRHYTISEIQASSSIEQQRYPFWNLAAGIGASNGPMGTNGEAVIAAGSTKPETNSMQITGSVNLLGRVTAKDLFKFQNVDLSQGARWAIQTKFETPILNFIDASSSAGLTTIDDSANLLSGGAETRPYGMWHQYGRLPKADEGIYLDIIDVVFRRKLPAGDAPLDRIQPADQSLADHLGFSRVQKKLGRVANKKVIREAVVVVPFIESDNQRKFFEIDRRKIDTAINKFNSGPQASLSEDPVTAGDSIRQMVEAMQRYILPPSMDFITYSDKVDPFSMYIFEFTHELNQEDLTDIWQNLPPRIGRAFDKNSPNDLPTSETQKTVEITHTLKNGELLTNHPDKLQWMVFKVKQRAQKNYFNKTISNTRTDIPATLSRDGLGAALTQQGVQETDFIAGGTLKGATLRDEDFLISYNWPYDFFSLVELAKVEEDVSFGRETAPQTVLETLTEATTNLTQEGVFGSAPQEQVAQNVARQIEQLPDPSRQLPDPSNTRNITQQGAQLIVSEEPAETTGSFPPLIGRTLG
jgi:hypothetical protein